MEKQHSTWTVLIITEELASGIIQSLQEQIKLKDPTAAGYRFCDEKGDSYIFIIDLGAGALQCAYSYVFDPETGEILESDEDQDPESNEYLN